MMYDPYAHNDDDGKDREGDAMERCHSCAKPSRDVRPLKYTRADGVRGASYPECADCRRSNAARLEALGFKISRRSVTPLVLGHRQDRQS